MKRSEALQLIANQIDFIEGRFEGMRTNFTSIELSRADVILTTMESAGMQPPNLYPWDNIEILNYNDLGGPKDVVVTNKGQKVSYQGGLAPVYEWEPES